MQKNNWRGGNHHIVVTSYKVAKIKKSLKSIKFISFLSKYIFWRITSCISFLWAVLEVQSYLSNYRFGYPSGTNWAWTNPKEVRRRWCTFGEVFRESSGASSRQQEMTTVVPDFRLGNKVAVGGYLQSLLTIMPCHEVVVNSLLPLLKYQDYSYTSIS